MFVMLEPRVAMLMARRKVKELQNGPSKICCEQVLNLVERIPEHAALVLTPAEFEAIFIPPEENRRGDMRQGTSLEVKFPEEGRLDGHNI